MAVIDFDKEQPRGWPDGRDVGGVWVYNDDPIVVDGEEWYASAGGMGTEWIRIIDGKPHGNPHIVETFGIGKNWGYPNFSPELDDYHLYEEGGKWTPAVPVVIKTLEYTEYDVDYGEEYDTFEEAVRAGKEMAGG